MDAKRLFWRCNMGIAVAGWIFIIWGAYASPIGWLRALWVAVSVLWMVGHPLELAFALPVARKAGFTASKTVAATLIFGITWWMPVKLGVFKP